MINTLSGLLYLANAGRRQEFYPTKDRILKRYGEPDGFDLQLFRCWGCVECGHDGWWDGGERYVCGGSGTHHGFILDRYRLGSRVFHRPRSLPESWGRPRFDAPAGVMGEKNRIDGKTEGGVTRGAVSRRQSNAAAILLALAFGPKGAARKLWRRPAYLMSPWQRWTLRPRRWLRDGLPRIERCYACEGLYLMPPSFGRARGEALLPCGCKACDDVPF